VGSEVIRQPRWYKYAYNKHVFIGILLCRSAPLPGLSASHVRGSRTVAKMGSATLAHIAAVLTTALVLSAQGAPSTPLALNGRQGGVGVLDISIPPNRKDDRYYTVSSSSVGPLHLSF
jgi:hypothetical protein